MHVRFSTCIGIPVIEEMADEGIASINGILIHPDTAFVEGFFVTIPSFLRTEELFLSSSDIIHWGMSVHIRTADVLAPLEDRVRLAALVEEGRTVLDQRVVGEGGRVIGTCRDVQFDTRVFHLEWIFPKKFLRWAIPIPTAAIVEVTPAAIIVRDRSKPLPVEPTEAVFTPLDPLSNTPIP